MKSDVSTGHPQPGNHRHHLHRATPPHKTSVSYVQQWREHPNNYSSPSLDVGIYLATHGNLRSTWATLIGPEAKPGTVHVPNNPSPQRPLPAFTVVTDPGLQPRSFLTIKTAASTGPPSYRTKADKNMWLLVVRPPRRPLLQRKYRRRRRRRLFRREKRLRK